MMEQQVMTMKTQMELGSQRLYNLSQIESHLERHSSLNYDVFAFETDLFREPTDVFPLRVDALLVIMCAEGEARIGIDLKEYEIRPNILVVIQPQNFIHLFELQDTCRIHVMACSQRMIEEVMPKLSEMYPLIVHHRTNPVTELTDEEAGKIDDYYRFICRQMQGEETRFKEKKIVCLLQGALFELMEINQRRLEDGRGAKTMMTRKEELMSRFLLLLSEKFRQERQVAYYAQKMSVSPKHLSSVVKELTGMTAGDWIENYVVMEAKVLLRTTDLSIQQISEKLNFSNQSFFGKYFKFQTGFSPTEFRKKNL